MKRGSRGHMDEPIRTIVVNRRSYEIHVNSDGEFTAHVAGDSIRHDTLQAVIKDIQKKARKLTVTIAVPVTILGHSRWTGSRYNRQHAGSVHHGTITEYDNDEGTYRVKFADGGTETFERFGGGRHDFEIARPMSDADVAEWMRLRTERDAAAERFDDYVKRFEFKDVHNVVKQAYNDAIDLPNEEAVDHEE